MTQSLDNERERVLAALQDHFAHDRLSLEDFEERTDRAERASGAADLSKVLADLPAFDEKGRRIIEASAQDAHQPSPGVNSPASPAALVPTKQANAGQGAALSASRSGGALVRHGNPQPTASMLALFSQTRRNGPWQPPQALKVRSYFGEARLDFREAQLGPGLTEIHISSVFGSTKIIVPPDLPVECAGTGILGDFADHHQGQQERDPAVPRLRIHGRAIFGSVEIAVKRL